MLYFGYMNKDGGNRRGLAIDLDGKTFERLAYCAGDCILIDSIKRLDKIAQELLNNSFIDITYKPAKPYQVNFCWACNFCGSRKYFDTQADAEAYARKISPYCSCLHVGKMPDGVGVINYPNPDCEYIGCGVGNKALARKIQELFF